MRGERGEFDPPTVPKYSPLKCQKYVPRLRIFVIIFLKCFRATFWCSGPANDFFDKYFDTVFFRLCEKAFAVQNRNCWLST